MMAVLAACEVAAIAPGLVWFTGVIDRFIDRRRG